MSELFIQDLYIFFPENAVITSIFGHFRFEDEGFTSEETNDFWGYTDIDPLDPFPLSRRFSVGGIGYIRGWDCDTCIMHTC